MTKSKIKAKTKSVRRNTRAQAERQSMLNIPKLPNEILDSILAFLNADGDFSTLCSVAQANRNLYNLVIPKIYETVVFNKNNQRKIAYGQGKSSARSSRNGAPVRPTRKDLAVACTRKLVFNEVSKYAISKYYRSVKEVVIGSTCLSAARWHLPSLGDKQIRLDLLRTQMKKCLHVVTSPSSLAEFLHICLQKERGISYEYDDLGTVLASLESAVPLTYEFFDFRVRSTSTQLYMAYNLEGIVNFVFSYPPDPSIHQIEVAKSLASHLDECFEEEDVTAPAGQVFFCNTIIPYVLSALEELHSTETVEDTALIKICKFITIWPDLSGSPYKSKLDFLKSRVKLVKPGFRPSLADLIPTPQAEQSLTHILLEEDDLLAPVQRRDDDGGSSSDEYSGIETSEFGSDLDAESEDEE